MRKPRKGSRVVTVDGVDYSWFRGRKSTEVRNLSTNKAVHVPNAELEETVVDSCPCYVDEGDGYCWYAEHSVTLPAGVRALIRRIRL